MKKIAILLVCVFALTSFKANLHKTYLSVTEIEYSNDEQSLQIISRVFIDDFEQVLNQRYQKDISFSYKEDLSKHKDLMQQYLNEKLNISVDGKPVKIQLLGSKFDADQIEMFIEADEVNDFNTITVKDLMLTDLFDSQKNIVNIKKNSEVKSMLLMKSDGQKTINF
ncbi:hypothetical protein C7S20_01605 [Christiangramia fulva]|uniref:Peptidase E n=1 Tax=Christiangramia fulva TaxID=2126553 RepID=A0A2R3Z1C1_9FLAO|nr:DUF6702 family protein [Christiangramia fulva]AVR44060.1 hypothetical protein C7S20_01605 [Christiangramia fulva]